MISITSKTVSDDKNIIKSAKFRDVELFYKFPKFVEDELTDRLDPFIYALIFPMMETGGDFYFDGEVSKSVLDNIEKFCEVWKVWCPDKYKPITIKANEVDDEYRPENNKMILAFGGGLDAAYSAYKFKNHLAGRFNGDLDKSVMVLGADIPLKNKEQFETAFINAKKMTDDIGITLIPAETNFRDIFNCNWEHCFATSVLPALCFFSKKYSTGIMANGSAVSTVIQPWGQHPAIDQYLNSVNFKFITDGYEYTRTERAGFIKQWKTGIDNLRVCWRNKDKSKNCGKCEKCIRTKLNFYVNGIKHLESMPNDFNFRELYNLHILRKFQFDQIKESIEFGIKNKTLSKKDIINFKTFIVVQTMLIKIKNCVRAVLGKERK